LLTGCSPAKEFAVSQIRTDIERKTALKQVVIGVRAETGLKELVAELESVFESGVLNRVR
jgi:hypothetical protein